MDEQDPKPQPPSTAPPRPPSPSRPGREDALAQALRANLKRRKAAPAGRPKG